jgi:hypothetical protein
MELLNKMKWIKILISNKEWDKMEWYGVKGYKAINIISIPKVLPPVSYKQK